MFLKKLLTGFLLGASLFVALHPYSFSADFWTAGSNGQHSFQKLGQDYFVTVPVKSVPEGSRLVLFNDEAAKRLGIEIPENEADLEKWVLEHFGKMVSSEKTGNQMMATRYLDSHAKKPGEALGDGRAIWAGEFNNLDVVLKGAGQTPLAWTNHYDPTHRDGLQGIKEATHCFIHSEANFRNGIDSTVDLAVILLPSVREASGNKERAAITLRLGDQFRVAHLRYFADEPKKFDPLLEYIVHRELRLAPKAKVTPEHVKHYLREFTKTLADESARYFDLHAVHGSPTPGNRTTHGGTIDMGTFRYLDAHHKEYSYLDKSRHLDLGHDSQTVYMENYRLILVKLLEEAKSRYAPSSHEITELGKTFRKQYFLRQEELFLARLGLPDEKIRQLTPELRTEFRKAAEAVYRATGDKKISAGSDKVTPAAFEPRKIFSQALEVFKLPADRRDIAWYQVFKNIRTWGASSEHQNTWAEKKHFTDVCEKIVTALNPSPVELDTWISRAKTHNQKTRLEPGADFFYGPEKYAVSQTTLDAIEQGKDFKTIRNISESAIHGLVDEGLPPKREFEEPKQVKPSGLECLKLQFRLLFAP